MAAPEREPVSGESEQEAFVQPTLEGFEAQTEEETLLEACIITALPVYTKRGKQEQWHCSVYAPPDIFNQDRDIAYEVHATGYAQEAKRKNLKPGDVVTLRGTLWAQMLELQGGKTRIINHLTVSHIDVLSRSPRKSVTLFEQEQQGK
jgi:hypothetical protein